MARKEPPRAATLAAVLARALPDARPGAIAWAVGVMIEAARAHQKWSETMCSYPLTDAQQRRGDSRCHRLAMLAVSSLRVAADHDKGGELNDPTFGVNDSERVIVLEFGGDPRGPCGSLHISDMPGDGFGPGWSIYA